MMKPKFTPCGEIFYITVGPHVRLTFQCMNRHKFLNVKLWKSYSRTSARISSSLKEANSEFLRVFLLLAWFCRCLGWLVLCSRLEVGSRKTVFWTCLMLRSVGVWPRFSTRAPFFLHLLCSSSSFSDVSKTWMTEDRNFARVHVIVSKLCPAGLWSVSPICLGCPSP